MLEKKIWIKSEKDYENEYDIEYKNYLKINVWCVPCTEAWKFS